MPKVYPELHSHPVIRKHPTPILTSADLPYPSSLVFNAGVIKYNGEYVMIFRNDYGVDQPGYERGERFAGTGIGVARSKNGVDGWIVEKKPLMDSQDIAPGSELRRLYDPRITEIEGKLYLCMAMDTRHGIRGCIAELNDTLDDFEIISASVPENRNFALFPQKVGNEYIRLERPMPVYSRGKDRFDLWLSRSPDLIYWGRSELILAVEDVPFANNKIGPTASPILTEKGWLTLFHAVDLDTTRGKNGWEDRWQKRYTAGMMLLDRDDPSKVLSVFPEPLLAPETPVETEVGFRQNVIFPCGMLLEDDGEVKIYYGASDTVVCLATAQLDDLLQLF